MSTGAMCGKQSEGATICEVRPGSIAYEAGIEPGDALIEMCGMPVRDVLDVRFLAADEEVTLLVRKQTGETLCVEVTKEPDEPLGLDFPDMVFDGVRRCRNRCVFCFVDQLPPGMRASLYVKDDDYRLSFLTGTYITLTNLGPGELERIVSMRLSPLYVSVHSTNPATRGLLLGRACACDVMGDLAALVRAGICVHTQVVLCPGVNDGDELRTTVRDLAGLFPGVRSCAVVPVGLTRHRRGLPRVSPVGQRDAAAVIRDIHALQAEFLERLSSRFVFASDEFYLRAGERVPPAQSYEDFPQLENGVGMLRLWFDGLADLRSRLPAEARVAARVAAVTGEAAHAAVGEACKLLSSVKGLSCRAIVVKNRFFGPRVTVAGLLVGRDVARTVLTTVGEGGCDALLVPRTCLKADEPRFLDDMTTDDLASVVGMPVDAVAPSPASLAEAALRRGGLSWQAP